MRRAAIRASAMASVILGVVGVRVVRGVLLHVAVAVDRGPADEGRRDEPAWPPSRPPAPRAAPPTRPRPPRRSRPAAVRRGRASVPAGTASRAVRAAVAAPRRRHRRRVRPRLWRLRRRRMRLPAAERAQHRGRVRERGPSRRVLSTNAAARPLQCGDPDTKLATQKQPTGVRKGCPNATEMSRSQAIVDSARKWRQDALAGRYDAAARELDQCQVLVASRAGRRA